jgi:hypothetical protein
MSDRSPDTQDAPPVTTQSGEINPSRRKLTGAALGVSAVFTLASRPVWANQCTISGMASGNLSAPKGPSCAGCTPGYWKVDVHLGSWGPTSFIPVSLPNKPPADTFNAVFRVTQYKRSNGIPYTLLEVMRELKGSGDPISTNLGFHAVAALLNAAHPNVNYGYTPGEIIDLFRNNLHRAAALKDSLEMLNQRACPLN